MPQSEGFGFTNSVRSPSPFTNNDNVLPRLKVKPPPEFDARPHAKDRPPAQNWFRKLEAFFGNVESVSVERQIQVALSYIIGLDEAWDRFSSQYEGQMTWSVFRNWFLGLTADAFAHKKAREQLRTLRQGSKSIQEYALQFRALEAQMSADPHSALSPNELLSVFQSNMDPAVRARMPSMDYAKDVDWTGANFDRYVRHAIIVESALLEERRASTRANHNTNQPHTSHPSRPNLPSFPPRGPQRRERPPAPPASYPRHRPGQRPGSSQRPNGRRPHGQPPRDAGWAERKALKQHRRDNNLCYTCGAADHQSRDCKQSASGSTALPPAPPPAKGNNKSKN
jgi:hypothetical protein